MKKRILSVILTLAMCLSMLPPAAFAAEVDTGLCDHHAAHTADCGYAEAVAGSPCAHEHTAECYTAGVLPSGDEDSGDAYDLEGDAAQTNTLLCTHTGHDDTCGYIAAVEAHPCHYACAVCAAQELIDALPDEVTAENAVTVAAHLDAIDLAKAELTADELTLLDLTKYTAAAQALGALAAAEVTCTCETKCAEDAINPDCPVCAAGGTDLTSCTGEEVPAAPACTCETDDPAIHAVGCAAYVAPEKPECKCVEKCTEPNLWCDICGFDVTACQGGEEEAVVYETYTIWVGGVQVTSDNASNVLGDGTVSYNPETYTLTLNNANITAADMYAGNLPIYAGIYVGNSGGIDSLNIKLIGTNIIKEGTGTGNVANADGIYSKVNLTISDGTLDVSGANATVGSHGINANGLSIAITDATVIAKGSSEHDRSRGISGDPVTISGNSHVIAEGSFYSGNCTVAEGTDYYTRTSADGEFTKGDKLDLFYSYREIITAAHLGDYTQSDDTHSLVCPAGCTVAATVVNGEACYGGEATCTEKAVCTVCGKSYGEQPAGHTPVYTQNEDGSTITATCSADCGYSATATISALSDLTYNGSAQKGATVEYSTGWAGGNLTITYDKTPTNAGSYTASITIGGVTASVDFTIAPKTLTGTVTVSPASLPYTGRNHSDPVVTVDGLTADDYEVSFPAGMINSGEYTITIVGKGNYTGEASGTYTISKAAAQNLTGELSVVNGHANTYSFDLSGVAPTSGMWGGSSQLSYAIDSVNFTVGGYYTSGARIEGNSLILPINEVESSDNGSIGTVTVKIISQNFEDSTLTLTVNRTNKTVVDASISLAVSDITYGADPAPSYSYSGTSSGTPVWTLTYSKDGGASWHTLDNLKENGKLPAGDYTVKAHYDDNTQIGEATAEFKVNKAAPTVTAPTAKTLTYNGSAQELVNSGTATGGTMVYSLTEDSQFSETIPTGTNAGGYTVWYYVQGDNNHNDSAKASVEVTIARADISGSTVTVTGSYTYNGTAQTPEASSVTVTLMLNGVERTLEHGEDKDYTYAASNNINAGTATVTVTGTGNYTGTASGAFTINKDTSATPPAAGEGYTIDYAAETITVLADYEVSTTNNGTGTAVPSGSVAAYLGKTLYIRKTESQNHTASGWTAFDVAARPTAPFLTKQDETLKGQKNGSLSTISDAMEYRVNSGSWTAGANAGLSDLEGGAIVEVRVKATGTAPCSTISTYTIAAGAAITVQFAATTDASFTEMPSELTDQTYGAKLTKPDDPTPSDNNYAFVGWYKDAAGSTEWDFAADTLTAENVTLYAKWKQVKFTVGVTVYENNSTTPVGGASVKLMRGTDQIESATTNEAGTFTFANHVPVGIYNVVVTRTIEGEEQTKTALIEIVDHNVTESVNMPPKGVSSKLQISENASAETPSVVVGGLDTEAEELFKDNTVEKVTLSMAVEGKSEAAAEGAAEIKALDAVSDDAVVSYLDVSIQARIVKNGESSSDTLSSTATVMEIIVEFQFDGRKNVKVHRYHVDGTTGTATTFREVNNRNNPADGTCWLDTENNLIHIFSSQFSTLAISSEANTSYTITLNAGGGTLTDSSTVATGTNGKLATLPSAPTRSGYTFKGWYTAASGGEQVTTSTLFSENTIIYAQWTQNSVSPGGGGGGGYTPPAQSITVPISGEDKTIQVGATVSGKKATIKSVDLTALNTVIGDHVEDVGTVTIDFSVLDKEITTVEIPANVVKQIANAVNDPGNDAESLLIVLSDGTSIEFDAVALGEKSAQADGLDITISIKPAKDAKPNRKQEETIKGRPAYDITVTSGGEHIDYMGGMITVHAPYELQDGEHPRGIVVWYVDKDGNKERCATSYDSVNKRVNWKTDHLSLYMIGYDPALAEICDGGEGCPSAAFVDVDTSLWYHEALDYAIENGLMGGYGNGYFGPNDNLSRGMLAQILYNLEGRPAVSGVVPFTDVAGERYYYNAILWVQQNGIVGGYGGGLFGPDDNITREQLAVMLWRYAGTPVATKKELDFSDADEAGSWALDALIWAQENGIMQGSNNAVDPKGNATRAHVAQMLKNFLENVLK